MFGRLPGENLRKTGKEMEDLAAEYLSSRAVRILERNFRSREAEIDIIGQQDETLLFVEVKARKAGEKSGSGLEAVGAAKQKRICRCADYYMHEKGIDPFSTGIRFDVIAITMTEETAKVPSSGMKGTASGHPVHLHCGRLFPYHAVPRQASGG